VTQSALQFTHILGRLKGTTRARPQAGATASIVAQPVDDPATSPYPIWRSSAGYDAGYKVVWHREIYEARWWTQTTPPDASSSDSAANPWLLIGPVPAHSHRPAPQLLVKGRQPRWSRTRVYHAGARISYQGLPFQARWWTRGDRPATALPADDQSAWRPLYRDRGEPAATAS
jgi:chitinase